MATEIAKSLEGQRRLAAASAKLDVSVEQLGNPLRSDMPQVKSELPAKRAAKHMIRHQIHQNGTGHSDNHIQRIPPGICARMAMMWK